MNYSVEGTEKRDGNRGHVWARFLLFGGGMALLLGIGLSYLLDTGLLVVQPKQSPRSTKVLMQRYELKNQSGRLQKSLYFWVRGVVSQTNTDHLIKSESNRDHHVQTDHLGNRILIFPVEQIPPYGSVIVENKAYLAPGVGDDDETGPLFEPDEALQAAPLIEADAPQIVTLARSFRQTDETQRAKAIYDWIVENIQVSPYQSRPLGALKTLQAQKGDCTEFAHLYAALARAAGLPARVMAGYRYQGRAVMRPDDLHNWVEVYLNGRWRIADAHARNFLRHESSYVAVLRLDMRQAGELQGHQRYRVSNAAIEVRQF